MVIEFLWLLFDVVVGLVLAGALVPLVLAAFPESLRSSQMLIGVGIGSILVVSLLRRWANRSRQPRTDQQ